jgi:putative ABC transport system substrate-binding protein
VAELVRWKPDVIIVSGGADALVVREVAASLPMVVAGGGDLVAMGLVASLRRPGGNVTDLQILSLELTTRHLELLRELLPRLSRVAMLQPTTRQPEIDRYFDRLFGHLDTASRALSIEAVRFAAETSDELDTAFAEMRTRRAQAVIVPASSLMFNNAGRFSTLAARYPCRTCMRSAPTSKRGLISYGYNYKDIFRRSARFAARILKGAKPADLPIEQAARGRLEGSSHICSRTLEAATKASGCAIFARHGRLPVSGPGSREEFDMTSAEPPSATW